MVNNSVLSEMLIRKRRQFFNMPQFQAPQVNIPQVNAPQVPSISMPNAPSLPQISLPSPSSLLNGLQNDISSSFVSKIKAVLGRLTDPRFWYFLLFLAIFVLGAYCCLCTPLGNMCYQCTRFSLSSFRNNFKKKNKVGVDNKAENSNDNKKGETNTETVNEEDTEASDRQKTDNPI
jgi:hypothetical protein